MIDAWSPVVGDRVRVLDVEPYAGICGTVTDAYERSIRVALEATYEGEPIGLTAPPHRFEPAGGTAAPLVDVTPAIDAMQAGMVRVTGPWGPA